MEWFSINFTCDSAATVHHRNKFKQSCFGIVKLTLIINRVEACTVMYIRSCPQFALNTFEMIEHYIEDDSIALCHTKAAMDGLKQQCCHSEMAPSHPYSLQTTSYFIRASVLRRVISSGADAHANRKQLQY